MREFAQSAGLQWLQRGLAAATSRRSCFCLIGLVVLLAARAPAAAQAPAGASPPLMERDREIALALSACPPAVADKAAVYVLGPSGYVKARDGCNGFTAIVQHS